MGVIPSQTSYYTLPSNAIRVCRGHDHCFCDGGYHRKEKYVYVDRRSDGRERYYDMMELMGKYIQNGGMAGSGGGGGGMGQGAQMGWPFRDAREWTIRDYDRLGDVMKEFYDRERGRGRWAPGGNDGGGGGTMGMPQMYPGMAPGMMSMSPQMMGMNMPMNGPGMMPQPPMMPPPTGESFAGSRSGARHQHQHPSMEEFQRLQQDLEDKFREYNRHMGVLFGTEQDRQKDQYRTTMLKTLQEIMPQLAQMMAQQQTPMGMRGGMNPAMMGMNVPVGVPPQRMAMPSQNPMAYGAPNPAMTGQVPEQTTPMQSPYAAQGYNYDPMPPRRPYRRKKWQDRYDDGDAFCADTEPRRTTTPWDSYPYHGPGPGRFGGRRDGEDELLDGGAMPSRPRPGGGPFDGPGGVGMRHDFNHDDPLPPLPRRAHFDPPPTASVSMNDTIPPTVSGAIPSPHLGRRTMNTAPSFPSTRPGLARANTAMRQSHIDPDSDEMGLSSANVRMNVDPQMDAGAAAFDAAYGGGVGQAAGIGGFGRSSTRVGPRPGASGMRTGMDVHGMAVGYVPETAKLSQGRDVEDRRNEPDVGQGITDHTGR
ncbi:hypothetical protein DOTSEDRAFT_23658 [Dothistroma septosporum NZE10]|uniref:Uncharacterized protein n=1 Tax=Dothistroma septosporum (strain NZE10 / CBS 128990) TaxID=675120 RepID=N1PTC6_DOTSN|nr:hypothetical protein DOTSEDRAFT_23658 [Dothistroma septosporum NZE10]